jgi:hypothetical protein
MKAPVLFLADGSEPTLPAWTVESHIALFRAWARGDHGADFTPAVFDRLCVTAQAIASLEREHAPGIEHLAEAMNYEQDGGVAAALARGTWANGTPLTETMWVTKRLLNVAGALGLDLPARYTYRTRAEWLAAYRREHPRADNAYVEGHVDRWVRDNGLGVILY